MPFYGNLTENMAMTPLEYWTLWLLNAVEIVAHLLLTCPFSAVNFMLIMRTSILHKNLKFILLSQSCSIFARSLFRIIIVGYRLGSGDLTWGMTWWLIFLFTYAAYFRNILAHVLVLERVWATMDFKKYEWSTRPYFTIGWMFFVNALTFTNCLGNSLSSLTTFFNLLIWAFLLVFAVLEVAVVAWLWRYNDRIYRTQCIVQATLSERYQLAENIRTAKQLFPVLLIHFFNILLGVYVNWTVFFRAYGPLETPRGMFTYELINQFYMTIVAATNFAIEFSMIMCHPYLKRNLLFALGSLRSALGRLCCCPAATFQRRRVGPSSVSIDAGGGDGTSSSKKMSLTSVRGQEMLASERSEADEYFRQLRLLWERPKSKVAPAASSSYCE